MRVPSRGAVVLTAVVTGGALLATTSMTWFTAQAPSVLGGTTPVAATGGEAAPGLTGLGLVLLAAGAATALGRPWAARSAGVVVALAGLAVLAITVAVLGDPVPALQAAAAEATGVRTIDGQIGRTAAPYLTAALGVAGTALGILAVTAAPAWRATNQRFEGRTRAVGEPAVDERTRAMDDWDALGRGEDPSAPR